MRAIVDLSPKCGCVADIGSDHGLMPIALILEGRAQKAIATDISEKSLDKAKSNLRKYKMEDLVEIRTGDGLSILNTGDVQLIIIAGLGGQLIAEIVRTGHRLFEDGTLLLASPNQAAALLREALAKAGFETLDEDLVQENKKFYPMMLMKKGYPKEHGFLDYEFGRLTMERKHPLLGAYVHKRMLDALKMESMAAAADNNESKAALKEAKYRLAEYRRLLEWL
jgi:tRNA (adenine22-N1)-methyltransferase